MKKTIEILFLSDTHNRHNKMTLPPVDIICHTGDFSGCGREGEIKSFTKWFSKQDADFKLLNPGNHDAGWKLDLDKGMIEEYCIKHGIIYMKDKELDIRGLKFYGATSLPDFGADGTSDPYNIERCNEIPDDVDILLNHAPPYGIRDTAVRTGGPIGCIDLSARLYDLKPKIVAFGHIHESRGFVWNGETLYINSASVNLKNELNDSCVFTVTIDTETKEITSFNERHCDLDLLK